MKIEKIKKTVKRVEELETVRNRLEDLNDIVLISRSGRQLALSKLEGDLVENLKPYLKKGLDDLEMIGKDEIEHYLNNNEEEVTKDET